MGTVRVPAAKATDKGERSALAFLEAFQKVPEWLPSAPVREQPWRGRAKVLSEGRSGQRTQRQAGPGDPDADAGGQAEGMPPCSSDAEQQWALGASGEPSSLAMGPGCPRGSYISLVSREAWLLTVPPSAERRLLWLWPPAPGVP